MVDMKKATINLDALRQVDVRTVNPDTLVDIREVTIDRSLPKEQRMEHYLQTL